MSFDSFLELLDAVPAEFCRSFDLIKKLDKKSMDLEEQMNACIELYKKAQSRTEREKIKAKSDDIFQKLIGFSNDKIDLAIQSYDVIDRNIRKMTDLGIIKREPTKDEEAAGLISQQEVPLNFNMPIDPSEPKYCSCNSISHGEMIGCDNRECPIEWYHLECVKLKVAPKGKWYCDICRKSGFVVRRNKKPRRY